MKLKDILMEESSYKYIKQFENGLAQIEQKYSSHTTDSDFIPSAPDTSKFKAARGGMIELDHAVHVHGGRYGFPRYFPVALKVGGNVDLDVHRQIKSDVQQLWNSMTDEDEIKTNQGTLRFDSTSGTNWSAYGITLR